MLFIKVNGSMEAMRPVFEHLGVTKVSGSATRGPQVDWGRNTRVVAAWRHSSSTV